MTGFTEALTFAALGALAVNILAAAAMVWKRKQFRASIEHARLERLAQELRGTELKKLRRAVEEAERREHIGKQVATG
jgi:hypothetical protein